MDRKEELFEKMQEKKGSASGRESSTESFYSNKSEMSIATESELIDVDDIELSDEESWLYKSPKKLSFAEKPLSTCKWLGNEVETVTDRPDLRSTKDSLANKISQLQLLGIGTNNSTPVGNAVGRYEASKSNESSKNNPKQISVKGKENEILDVADVCKMAQLQEESLKQSCHRFLSLTEKRDYQEKNHFLLQNSMLNKPASAEDLNFYTERRNDERPYKSVPMQQMKKLNIFNSSPFLNDSQDGHRGSLPNINPGYYSLRAKKSRKSTEQRLPCPLPIHPTATSKFIQNGSMSDVSSHESQVKHLTSPTMKKHESRTLPSSYRIHSRNNSASQRDSSVSYPQRGSSVSHLSNPRNSPSLTRRDSAPCTATRYYTSPLSSPTLYQRSKGISSPGLRSPNQSFRNSPKNLTTPPSPSEYQRSTNSHSPSRRLPLTTVVHNSSQKSGRSPVTSPCTERLRNCKLQSKIPSPGSPLRSGIPVPSTFSSKINAEDESWSRDCY